MRRYEDWALHLECFLAESRNREFVYGVSDCCLFAADCVEAMTGTDIAAEYRGKYSSRKSALRLAKSLTGRASVRALVETGLSMLPTSSVRLAHRGDLVLVRRPKDWSLGIVALNGREVLAVSAVGFVRLPLHLGVRAWHV